jgi:hypothetical protein
MFNKNNCLIWALVQKTKYGGEIRWHKAKTWIGFHTTWTDPKTNFTWEYTVTDQSRKQWWYIPVLYTGVIKQVSPKKLIKNEL